MKFYFIEPDGHYRGATAERESCPPTATDIAPSCDFPWWNGTGWETDATLKAKVEAEKTLTDARIAAITTNLPTRVQVRTAVQNISSLADAKAFLLKLADVVYWLAKNAEE